VPTGQPPGRDTPAAPPSTESIFAILTVCQVLIRREGRDLTARQLAGFLLIYTAKSRRTVTALADAMNIPAPGVTRMMDRLAQLGLIVREKDRRDRRRILVRRTPRGVALFDELAALDVHPPALSPRRDGGSK
jgi:DNA-binding MarR family transcriptional regulator